MSTVRTSFISAGHSTVPGRDRGAVGNGLIEGVEAARIRTRVVQILRSWFGKIAIVDVDDSILSQTIAFFRNKTTSNCIVLDIHFNAAADARATGTETFVPSDATSFELDLAFCLSHVAHTTLGLRKRGNFRGRAGVKSEAESHHGRLGFMRLTGENVLIEVGFISNPNDVKAYQENFERYCQDIALVLYKFAVGEQRDILDKIK